jgi:hypothetical protein
MTNKHELKFIILKVSTMGQTSVINPPLKRIPLPSWPVFVTLLGEHGFLSMQQCNKMDGPVFR